MSQDTKAQEISRRVFRRYQAKHGSDRVWLALSRINDEVPDILEMTRTGEDLEPWQVSRLSLAAEYIDSVHDALTCRSAVCPDAPDLSKVASEETRTAQARALVMVLLHLLEQGGFHAPNVQNVLTLASRNLLTVMSPRWRMASQQLRRRLMQVIEQSDADGGVLAKAITVLVGGIILDAAEPWLSNLEGPIGKLNVHLTRTMAPPQRSEALQLSRRLYTMLSQWGA